MSNQSSFRDRLYEELTADLSVGVAAAVFGIPTLFAVAALTGETSAAMYATLDVAVFVPWVYDSHWPETYDAAGSVVWTLAATLTTVGLFVGAYAVSVSFLQEPGASISATVATVLSQYALAIAFERLRRRT